jgi:hypothetical protein
LSPQFELSGTTLFVEKNETRNIRRQREKGELGISLCFLIGFHLVPDKLLNKLLHLCPIRDQYGVRHLLDLVQASSTGAKILKPRLPLADFPRSPGITCHDTQADEHQKQNTHGYV